MSKLKQSVKVLTELDYETRCLNTKMPKQYVPKTKFTDTTANGLTKCIVSWINLNGWQAERISTMGRYIDNSKIVTDVLGNRKKIGTGKYIKGNGTVGSADISSTIKGYSIKWEVKMKDKQSEAQKEYQQAIERAGGKYFIVHDFDEFMMLYKGIIEQMF
jgi:hypothetical protein